jgi:hypothetical protein
LKNPGLVVFHCEVVMSVSLFDQVVGDIFLSQQGIGGNVFPFNIDGIEQWDGRLDFVGALALFIVYFQSTYFFWV